MTILGPNGEPISSQNYSKNVKSKSKFNPLMGEIAPAWAEGVQRFRPEMTANNTLQFDTSKLTLKDYRLMRDHYQVNSSLMVLSFMLHQTPWQLEGGDKAVNDWCEENLREIWTRLIRAFSQAFWAGYSPCALQWENDEQNSKIKLSKIKDLAPEDCRVKWKRIRAAGQQKTITTDGISELSKVERGGSKPHAKIYDGIYQAGYTDIPKENTVWYPVLMENGNMYGRKLLNSAFQPWFFSLMIHLYSNRYFERFGEPAMVGRAPYDDEISVNGTSVPGHILMQQWMTMVRNGAVTVLPNNRLSSGISEDKDFEYQMEYVESQMRGADFDRYIERLDEEISLSLFTPMTLMRGSQSGYNSDVTKTQIYQWQINSILADMKEYIDRYIIDPMARFNFGDKAKIPKIRFAAQGVLSEELIRTMMAELLRKGAVKVDVKELGQHTGLTLEEIEVLQVDPATGAPAPGGGKPGDPGVDPKTGNPAKSQTDTRTVRQKPKEPTGVNKKRKVNAGMMDRVLDQYSKWADKDPSFKPTLGYYRQYTDLFVSKELADESYDNLQDLCMDTVHTAFQCECTRDELEELLEPVFEKHFELVEA